MAGLPLYVTFLLGVWAVMLACACATFFIILHEGEETWPCTHLCLLGVVGVVLGAASAWVVFEREKILAIPRSGLLAIAACPAALLAMPVYLYVSFQNSEDPANST